MYFSFFPDLANSFPLTLMNHSLQIPVFEVLQLRHVPRLLLCREGREVQESQDDPSNARVLYYGKLTHIPVLTIIPARFISVFNGIRFCYTVANKKIITP